MILSKCVYFSTFKHYDTDNKPPQEGDLMLCYLNISPIASITWSSIHLQSVHVPLACPYISQDQIIPALFLILFPHTDHTDCSDHQHGP